MYLSRIHFTPQGIRKQCRQGIVGNVFREHQMIWGLFDNAPDQQRDFLYRREDKPGEVPFYYVLSERQPMISNEKLIVETKPFEPCLQAGDHLQFLLRVNAVVTRKADDNSKRRIRRDIIEACIDQCRLHFSTKDEWPSKSEIHQGVATCWLGRQGEKHGFELLNCMVMSHNFHKVRKPGDHNPRHFTSLDVRGDLTVTAPDAYLAALKQGIGRSKAYGCGLMLVRRM